MTTYNNNSFHVIFNYLFFPSNCGTFFGDFWRKINKKKFVKQILQHFAEPELKTLAGRRENSKTNTIYFMIWPTISIP